MGRMRYTPMLLAALGAEVGAQQLRGVRPADAIPDAPAFTFLNATPTSISRPGTARDFGVALGNGINESGQVRQGLAFDVGVWQFIRGVRITSADYRASTAKYALYNTQFSLGTARSAGDSASTDLAIGIRTLLFDNSDPMKSAEFLTEIRPLQQKCGEPKKDAGGNDVLPTPEDEQRCIGEVNVAARERWFKANWNSTALALAVAAGSRLEDSRATRQEWNGWSGWLVGTFGLGASGLVSYQARYDDRVDFENDEAHRRTLTFGARAAAGSPVLNAFLELLGTTQLKPSSEGPKHAKWSGGVEFLAAQGLWVSTGFGNSYAPATKSGDRVLLIANIRWNVSQGPRFTQP
jgi:hypothetical protein